MNDLLTAAATGFHSKVLESELVEKLTSTLSHGIQQKTKNVASSIASHTADMVRQRGEIAKLIKLADLDNLRLGRENKHLRDLNSGRLSWTNVMDMVGITAVGSAALGVYLADNTKQLLLGGSAVKTIGAPPNKPNAPNTVGPPPDTPSVGTPKTHSVTAPKTHSVTAPRNQIAAPTTTNKWTPPTPAAPTQSPGEILKALRIDRGQSSLPQIKEPPKTRKRSKPNADIGFNNDDKEDDKLDKEPEKDDPKEDPKEGTPDGTETPPGGDETRGTGDDGGGNGEMFWTTPVALDSGEPPAKKHKGGKKPKKHKKTVRFK